MKSRLQIIHPRHDPQDPYGLTDLYEAASYILQGNALSAIATPSYVPTATGPQIKTELQSEIQSAMRSAVAELGEMFKNVLGAQPTINTNPRPPLPPGRITASNDGSSKCNFCGVPGHFMRECEVANEYMRLGKCKRNVEGKIVLPASAVIPQHITGTWLRDRIDEYHRQNPGQMAGSAAQMLLETTTVVPEVSLI